MMRKGLDEIWTNWVLVSGDKKGTRVKCLWCDGHEQLKNAPKCRKHTITCTKVPDDIRKELLKKYEILNTLSRIKRHTKLESKSSRSSECEVTITPIISDFSLIHSYSTTDKRILTNQTMEFNFNGKIILVTGAGRGIGRAVAKSLARSGAKVIALSKTKETLDSLVEEFPSIRTINVDISDWNATKTALKNIAEIDGLVNNAGVAKLTTIGSITEEDFNYHFDVNVKAIVNITQEMSKVMKQNGRGGTVVNVSSQASKVALKDHLIYGASKAAVDHLTREFAAELGPHKIRVNAVNPTVTWTEMAKIGWSNEKVADALRQQIPLRKFAEVEEVVNVILFLLSDLSSMVNGVTMPVDGGFTIV